MDAELATVRRALDRLGDMEDELATLAVRELTRKKASCESLGSDARRSYETDQPLSRTTAGVVALAPRPGEAAETAALPGELAVSLLE